MNTLVNNYLETLKLGNKAEATVRVYRKDLTKFVEFFGVSTYSELDALTVEDFNRFYTEQSEDLSANSLNGLIRSLSAWFSHLRSIKAISKEHAFFDVSFGGRKFVKVAHKKKIVLSDDEAKALLDATGDNIQDKFMIFLMLTTGLRRDEVCKIKLSDIRNTSITIKGKGNKERVTFMNSEAVAMLEKYLATAHNKGEYLFFGTRGEASKSGEMKGETVNNRIRHYAFLAKIDTGRAMRITAHRLRATMITNVIREHGLDAGRIVAGHENISTTQIYNEAGDEVTRKVIEGMAGKAKFFLGGE